jgi:hypothetical protein
VFASSKDIHLETPQEGAVPADGSDIPSAIIATEYKKHQLLFAQRKEVITSLPDRNNEEIIANIDQEFANKQHLSAVVLLDKIIFLRDAVYATGFNFHGIFRVDSVEVSEGGSSALVIISGTPLDHKNNPLLDDPIDLAITNETYILYTQL